MIQFKKLIKKQQNNLQEDIYSQQKYEQFQNIRSFNHKNHKDDHHQYLPSSHDQPRSNQVFCKLQKSKSGFNIDVVDREQKDQKFLTQEERRMVGDISKLFQSEQSKPTKLFIRLNQTQSNKPNKYGQDSTSFLQNRLDKIEVTRINQEEEDSKRPLMQKYTSINNDKSIKQQINLNGSNGKPGSEVQIQFSQRTIITRNLKIYKEVAIMFVPEFTVSTFLGMKNPPPLFSKFNRNQQAKIETKSNFSNELLGQKTSKNNDLSPQTSNFVKLLEIQLFLKRKQIRHQRSQQLRHSNQKLLSAHLLSKQQLQKAHICIKNIQDNFQRKQQQLKNQLQQEKKINKNLSNELQSKIKSNLSLSKLNQQYLKQNNQLKQKIKQYIKIIHELKNQITNKKTFIEFSQKKQLKPQVQNKPVQIPSKQDIKHFHTNQNQYSNACYAKPLKKQITFNLMNQEYDINSQFYNPNPNAFEAEDKQVVYQLKKQEKSKNQPRLINCRSQDVFNRQQIIIQQRFNTNNNYQLTSRSQKTLGIKKNNLNKEPISPSTRNLVRVNKNVTNDASILIGQKLRDNKSLSSISNLSGKSLSQRIGYISKPVKDRKNGILVDYMIQSNANEQQETLKKEEKLKFQRSGK